MPVIALSFIFFSICVTVDFNATFLVSSSTRPGVKSTSTSSYTFPSLRLYFRHTLSSFLALLYSS